MLFGTLDRELRERLKAVDVTVLTPVEALNLLHQMAEEARRTDE
jgi:hypothetical protein